MIDGDAYEPIRVLRTGIHSSSEPKTRHGGTEDNISTTLAPLPWIRFEEVNERGPLLQLVGRSLCCPVHATLLPLLWVYRLCQHRTAQRRSR